MLIIAKQLRFETKIMDIANLVLLKLQKEPAFVPDIKFVKLVIQIMLQKKNYDGALKFLWNKKGYFEEKLTEVQL